MSGSETIAQQFLQDHPEDAASVLEGRPPDQAAALLDAVPTEVAAGALRRMTPAAAASCLGRLSSSTAAAIGAIFPAGQFAVLLRRLEPPVRESILTGMDSRPAAALQSLLQHPEDTAGALMDPNILVLAKDTRIEEAIHLLRTGPQTSTYYVYVVDRDQKLVGVLTMRELLHVQRQRTLGDLMHAPVARLGALANRREILDHPAWRVHHALPVVDDEGRFLGVIRYETVRDLEAALHRSDAEPLVLDTALRLGELMWIALGGLFIGLAGPASGERNANGGRTGSGS